QRPLEAFLSLGPSHQEEARVARPFLHHLAAERDSLWAALVRSKATPARIRRSCCIWSSSSRAGDCLLYALCQDTIFAGYTPPSTLDPHPSAASPVVLHDRLTLRHPTRARNPRMVG